FVSTEPAASRTAWLTKFSDAISSRPLFWRCSSSEIAAATSGSVSASDRQRVGTSVLGIVSSSDRVAVLPLRKLPFQLHDLFDSALMTAAVERRREPDLGDFVRHRDRDDVGSH